MRTSREKKCTHFIKWETEILIRNSGLCNVHGNWVVWIVKNKKESCAHNLVVQIKTLVCKKCNSNTYQNHVIFELEGVLSLPTDCKVITYLVKKAPDATR